ncbi:GGDEF domain-containing protein [Carnobacterium funditum]|uniref:GGDEF domain-containing protein n=1 Tax=Carnobacterium funditum TaxID=2752 RepID=UPI00068B61FC|nr:GGDEF domain-containing protein [Carnobacterium funditum]
MLSIYEGFFLNLCVLIASLFIYKQLFKKMTKEYQTNCSSIITGILGGLLGAILMHFSIVSGTNSIIDLRIIPLMLVVLYANGLSVSITALLIILTRFMVGISLHSFLNILFIITSWALFSICFQKIKNRWVSIVVMLALSNVVYTILIILFPTNKYLNLPLMINYWIICIAGGVVAVYIMDYLTESEFLFKQHKNFAFTDPLTGLNNVRSFDLAFNKAKKRQIETNETISIILLDIDRFKQVNDTYGHTEGDVVLKKLAAILKMNQGSYDVVSRNGGEEFSILLHDYSLKEVHERAESLRKIVENSFFVIKNKTLAIHITISVGITTYSDTTKEIDQLYDNADQALYAAKKSGRNKVCFYTQVPSVSH